MSNFDPNAPGNQQPWGAAQPSGQPPTGDWGAAPGGGPQPGQQPYGSQLPPYGQFGNAQANWAPTTARGDLASWGQRAGGILLDWLIAVLPSIVLWILYVAAGSFVFLLLASLWGLAIGIWFAVQVGQVGSSPGMRMVGLKCVKADTGQVLGAGMGIVRALIHWVASAICGLVLIVDMLFPLWDSQRQTLADKVVGTIVVKVPPQGFSLTPKTTA